MAWNPSSSIDTHPVSIITATRTECGRFSRPPVAYVPVCIQIPFPLAVAFWTVHDDSEMSNNRNEQDRHAANCG